MQIPGNNTIQKIIAGVLLSATLAVPFSAFAEPNDLNRNTPGASTGEGGTVSSVGTGIAASCGGNILSSAVGYAIGLGFASAHEFASDAALAFEKFISVPETRLFEDHAKENLLTGQGGKNAAQFGDFWENLQNKFKEYCLDPLAKQIAIAIIRQMRNMVINYINTGNFGGKPTFITNFQFDARDTAKNAAKLFASNLTGIDFCNYFPQNPSLNLNFELNLRIGLQCSLQKPRDQFISELARPDLRTPFDDIMLLMPENDPLKVAIAEQEKLSIQVASAAQARQNQVVAGKGYIGIESCVKTKTIEEGYCINEATAQRCDNTGETGCPEGCDYVAPVTACEETKVQTPGAFVADIATEPLKSEFREGEAIHEFGEAIAAIINTLVSKVITTGLNRVFGS